MEYEDGIYEPLGESASVTLVKGIIGAVVGAIPGMLLWIILGKLGIIAAYCGILLAGGVVFGYNFMTKNGIRSTTSGFVICIAVLILSVYFSERIVWCWELSSTFKEVIPSWKDDLLEYYRSEFPEYSASEINSMLTEELGKNWFDDMVKETYGITNGTFKECFSHFSSLLKDFELKGKFTSSLLKSYLFAAIGPIIIAAKATK